MKRDNKCENCPYPSNDICRGETIEKCNVCREELQEHIKLALAELYNKDFYLIENSVNEVCIVAHFWRYFFNSFQQRYAGYDMDIEYNRNGMWAKYYGLSDEKQRKYAKPDMIIHKRGCNAHNFVCIEFKGEWNTEENGNLNDEEKLVAFTKQAILLTYDGKKYSYKYNYGIRLKLYRDKVEFKWFEGGEHKTEYDYEYLI